MENHKPTGSDSGEDIAENLSFEEAFQELEKIVRVLEAEQMTLEESINLYDRGQQLIDHCSTLLEKAVLRVQQIDNQRLVPFDVE